MPSLAIVAAVARNGVIGDDNRLIWRLRSDLKHFRALTMAKPMIMGRKTFQSIGKPLPGRETIVMTRDPAFRPDGVHVVGSAEEAIAVGQRLAADMGAGAIMIAGGGEIYRLLMTAADEIYLTEVEAEPAGDALFPPIDRQAFHEVSREAHPAGPDDEFAFSFVHYRRHSA